MNFDCKVRFSFFLIDQITPQLKKIILLIFIHYNNNKIIGIHMEKLSLHRAGENCLEGLKGHHILRVQLPTNPHLYT